MRSTRQYVERVPTTATPLDCLRPGERAVVTGLVGDGPIPQRLAEMGLVAGAAVAVVRYAPLGDPLEIVLDGYHLSLRRAEAACVRVRTNTDGRSIP